ncbi:uncharacterized protein LOC144179758 [Haemaphysalis longicornis]
MEEPSSLFEPFLLQFHQHQQQALVIEFADVLRKADEEMQWLIGVILAALAGVVIAAVFLVSCGYVCAEICRDIRQNMLILWDTLLFRDPCYRVLCSLAQGTEVRVPSYESYLKWKRGDLKEDYSVAAVPGMSSPLWKSQDDEEEDQDDDTASRRPLIVSDAIETYSGREIEA